MENFTIAKGLDVQKRQLSEWERILKPEFFKKICKLVELKNQELNHTCNGYHVLRGTDILNLILNENK